MPQVKKRRGKLTVKVYQDELRAMIHTQDALETLAQDPAMAEDCKAVMEHLGRIIAAVTPKAKDADGQQQLFEERAPDPNVDTDEAAEEPAAETPKRRRGKADQ